MDTTDLAAWATLFAPRFERLVPRRFEVDWLTEHVDLPRFGWDLATLDTGLADPIYRFVDARPLVDPGLRVGADARFLRAAFCCALIRTLPGGHAIDPLRFERELTCLELHATSAVMLDHLDNGSDLSSSQGVEAELALPVLITAAYSARQLAASMLWKQGAVPAGRRASLCQRFARLLSLQGIGHTLDLCGSPGNQPGAAGLPAPVRASDLEAHLRWYVTPLDFELPCELAAAAVGLDAPVTRNLVTAGADLGLTWYAGRVRRKVDEATGTYWRAGISPLRSRAGNPVSTDEALEAIEARAWPRARAAMERISPAGVDFFERFLVDTCSMVAPAAEVA